MPKQLEEIIDIPDVQMAQNKTEIDRLLLQTKAFTRDEFAKLLFKCHNIIRNNDKMSPEASFDEISKVLFIKIRYERDNSKTQIFSLKQFLADKAAYDRHKSKDSLPFYQQLFENTKEDFKDDELFASHETIKIKENSFEGLVKLLESYNLSTTSDDVKGIAFEEFLGKTFRGELGQFFTPRTLVDFMVDILAPEEGEIICDPCCGSGGFLIKAFEFVRAKIEADIQKQKDKIKTQYLNPDYDALPAKEQAKIEAQVNHLFPQLNQELDLNESTSRLRALSYDCIFGTDANARMARTAKMNMIMHGDGHGGVHFRDGFLNINGIFDNRFDVILTNPPFGAQVERDLKISPTDRETDPKRIEKYKSRYPETYPEALRQVEDNIGEPISKLYQTGKMSKLTEVLFIERCLNLLKPGGRMGIVLPEGVLNNTNLKKIRDFVEARAKIILIVSIPQDVFASAGATVKPSLVFLRKFTELETQTYQETQKASAHKYESQILDLKAKLALRGKQAPTKQIKKQIQADLKTTQEKIKQDLKAALDYPIPIAEIEKAGISRTGTPTENELEPLAQEFRTYRQQNPLWASKLEQFEYHIDAEDKLIRTFTAKPPKANF